MDEGGYVLSGLNINMQKASITLGIGEQALFIHKQNLIFAGQSFGYYTKFQNSTYDTAAPTRDIYVWKLDPSNVDTCFYSNAIDAYTLNSREYFTKILLEKNSQSLSSYYTVERGGYSGFDAAGE
jgi:hypothetical protein